MLNIVSHGHQNAFTRGLQVQMRVIGALLMRELHTRYGRENIGYLWLIGEPLMLAGVMALLHQSSHTAYGQDMDPLTFTVVGYTTYIMFRGIVNRSDGAVEANATLLYHRTVTIYDIIIARGILEAAGTTLAYAVLMTFLWSLGLVEPPARPLWYITAQALMFLYSIGQSMIIGSVSFHNRIVDRLVHPYTYFMIPLSGAFVPVAWVPEPYRTYLLYVPLPHILELARYGQFQSADMRYCDPLYVLAVSAVIIWVGLVTMRIYRNKIHLN